MPSNLITALINPFPRKHCMASNNIMNIAFKKVSSEITEHLKRHLE